ncbi:hypothetical protein [Telluribacter humicola]|uniref:hypothetical protein n=1 Tax=Telluribacter humicola TaxID=1720261 RepID=UPI001A96E504|nr:hypothetical protein [Telluribacter humicola]
MIRKVIQALFYCVFGLAGICGILTLYLMSIPKESDEAFKAAFVKGLAEKQEGLREDMREVREDSMYRQQIKQDQKIK